MRNLRSRSKLIGVISDTHGLLRPEVFDVFRGVGLILHAGDIGSTEVLDGLKKLAPVIAVRGNNDTGAWAKRIPETEIVRAGSIEIYMVHDVKAIAWDSARKCEVVVSGHSHRPSIDERDGVLFLNPGSAGPRRFKLPISVAKISIDGATAHAQLVALGP
jgi:putative phosphoesterase